MAQISYQKKTWAKGDYVTPTPLNRMENGIKAACDAVDHSSTESYYFDKVSSWQDSVLQLHASLPNDCAYNGHVRFGADANGSMIVGYKSTASSARYIVMPRKTTRMYSVRFTGSGTFDYKEITGGNDSSYPAS